MGQLYLNGSIVCGPTRWPERYGWQDDYRTAAAGFPVDLLQVVENA
jgi:hypothetical protein